MSDLLSSPDTGSLPQPAFKVYHPYNASNPPPPFLPDDYFTPSAADLKAAQASLSARTQALVNAPLQLKATREANERARRERWPQTTIRVRFMDRTQLERTFPSTDKIRSVYAFVRSCLREDIRPVKFILYQSPPKRDLKVSDPKVRDLSLFELQLAPSSVLLLRFEEDSLNHINVSAPLDPLILAQAVDLPAPHNDEQASVPTASGSQTIRKPENSTFANSGGKKFPKWFKLGQNK